MPLLTGRCLCESIAYEITGELGPVAHCHCSRCRRWHGAAFRTRCTVLKKYFRWVKGEELLSHYASSPNYIKTFCRVCGSSLITLYPNSPDEIGLPLGGLEQDPGTRPIQHIFVGSKSPWYEITDDLPQYDELPEEDLR